MGIAPKKYFENHIRGAIYGALAGDALGVPVEFSNRAQRAADPVREMRGFGTWHQPAGTWSDDGALLLCTLEALAQPLAPKQTEANPDSGRFDVEPLGALFVDWMRNGRWAARGNVFDIGATTRRALGRIVRGTPAQLAGGNDELDNGNGSLMRILPVALRFAAKTTPAELASLAMRASSITHAHPRSQLACAYLCLVAQQIIAEISTVSTGPESKPHTHARSLTLRCINTATQHFQTLLSKHPDERPHFGRLTSGDIANAKVETIESSGYVMHTLEAAFWCLLNNDTCDETILSAVNLGGDTDTTACVTGGLAGLLHGGDAIKPDWISALPRRDEIDRLIKNFTHSAWTC